MWKYVKFVSALFLMFAAFAGLKALFAGELGKTAQKFVENGIDTYGVIEKRVQHIVAGRVGRFGGAGVYYTLTYSFEAHDGRTYSNEIDVPKETAYAVADGQRIRVRYYRDQPTVNAAVDFKAYWTKEDVKDQPYTLVLTMCILMFLGGGLWAWLNWCRIRRDWGWTPKVSSPAARIDTVTRSSSRPATSPGMKPGFGRR